MQVKKIGRGARHHPQLGKGSPSNHIPIPELRCLEYSHFDQLAGLKMVSLSACYVLIRLCGNAIDENQQLSEY